MGLILVIDDHPDTVEMMVRLMNGWGHRTIVAESGEAGLALLASEKPDLIIVDGMMHGMNGMEFIRLLRAGEHTATIPAILHTAIGDHEFLDNAVEKGANEIWIKSRISIDQMEERVAHYIRTGHV